VVRVEELSPTMRRVVLGGSELEADFPFLTLATADHVKLLFPDEDTGELVMPEPGPSGPPRPDGRPVVMRDYTPRAFDAAAGELTVDFVVHEHGPAGRWGAAAAPGSPIGVLGPRGSQVYPALGHYLLVADETGLPALERFLEELPRETRVDAYVLSADGASRELPERSGAQLRWIEAGEPEVAGERVVGLVEALPLGADSFVWAAGEATTMRALRTWARRHPALTADRVAVRGYWRTGVAGALKDD
jgi:NADPH-dependent ferric siderophore reductase